MKRSSKKTRRKKKIMDVKHVWQNFDNGLVWTVGV